MNTEKHSSWINIFVFIRPIVKHAGKSAIALKTTFASIITRICAKCAAKTATATKLIPISLIALFFGLFYFQASPKLGDVPNLPPQTGDLLSDGKLIDGRINYAYGFPKDLELTNRD
jgi:hypothetical protein